MGEVQRVYCCRQADRRGTARDIAVITVYAACTDDSGGGKWQLEQEAELDIAAVHKKSGIAMLQYDLSQLIAKELDNCHIIIGGDWNQRHNSKSVKKQRQWRESQTWMKKHSLVQRCNDETLWQGEREVL
jgi:exonuclease III